MVTAAAITRDGHLLIAQRHGGDSSGLWELPGGKVEENEAPKDCLARELKEELGITAHIGPMIGSSSIDSKHGKLMLIAFMVNEFSGIPSASVHSKVEWIKPGEENNYEFCPADVQLVARAMSRIKELERKAPDRNPERGATT